VLARATATWAAVPGADGERLARAIFAGGVVAPVLLLSPEQR